MPCGLYGAAYPGCGHAFLRVQPAESRPQARLPAPHPPSVPQQIGVGPPRLRIVRIRMRQVKRQRAAGAGAVAEAEEEIAQGAGAEREFRVAFQDRKSTRLNS